MCACVYVSPLISSWGFGSGEVWQIMWHVVSGCHHVHPVSTVCSWVRAHEYHNKFFFFLKYIWPAIFVSVGCVAFLHFTPTRARPFPRGWRGGSGWASTSSPTQSGLRCHRKVRISQETRTHGRCPFLYLHTYQQAYRFFSPFFISENLGFQKYSPVWTNLYIQFSQATVGPAI